MDLLRRVASLCTIVGLASCAPASEPATAKPYRELPIERYADHGSVVFHDAHIHFGFERETPPPGFTASPPPAKDVDGGYKSLGRMMGKGGGVKTLIPLDDVGPVGRVEHYDATAPLFIAPIFASANLATDSTVFVPIVGPAGERLTRVYELVRPKGGGEGARATFTPLGSGPIPRVARLLVPTISEDHPDFVYVTDAGTEEGRPLYLPVTMKGEVVQPKGVVGASTFAAAPSPTVVGEWNWWLVRWKAADGEGWSLAQKPLLTDVGAGPQWVKVHETSLPGAAAFLGEKKNGHCDGYVHHADGGVAKAWVTDQESCEAALSVVTRVQSQVFADAKTAAVAAKNKERAEIVAAAENRKKAEEAALEAERKASGERWRKQQAEAPTLKKYVELVRAGKTADACKAAVAGLATDTHANLVLGRVGAKDFAQAEVDCVLARPASAATDRKMLDDFRAEVGTRIARLPAAPSYGNTPGQPGDASGRAHEEYMKRANDYTYGSGKASSCPYADRSLCR